MLAESSFPGTCSELKAFERILLWLYDPAFCLLSWDIAKAFPGAELLPIQFQRIRISSVPSTGE